MRANTRGSSQELAFLIGILKVTVEQQKISKLRLLHFVFTTVAKAALSEVCVFNVQICKGKLFCTIEAVSGSFRLSSWSR